MIHKPTKVSENMSDISQFNIDLQKYSLQLKYDEPLAPYSTMGVGGNARFFLLTSNSSQLEHAIGTASKYRLPYIIVGKGSNIIFSDLGYEDISARLNKIGAKIERVE